MNNSSLQSRSAGLDIVRSVAVFFVISVHFFLYNGYYAHPMKGYQMFFGAAFRNLFYSCVPLFLLLSGYLCSRKKLTRSYFGGIWRIIYVYTAVSIFTVLFRILYFKEQITFESFLKSYFEFSAAPYAWYIAMYIGLFLFIPFLNILWNGLNSPRKKQALLIIMIFCTALPSLLNGKNTFNAEPLIPGLTFNILPAYWLGIYPITYYFIGAYIREYQVKIKKPFLILAIAVVPLLEAAAMFIQSGGGNPKTTVDGYGSIFPLMISVSIFLLLYDINIKGDFWKGIFESISRLSLGIYLVSYNFDQIVYKQYLNIRVSNTLDRFKYYLPAVLLVFFASLFISAVIDMIYSVWKKSKKNFKKTDNLKPVGENVSKD